MHVRFWDVDMVQQCLPSLLVVALVVVCGNKPLVTPVQVDFRPVDLVEEIKENPEGNKNL